jgi:hypothetical protein
MVRDGGWPLKNLQKKFKNRRKCRVFKGQSIDTTHVPERRGESQKRGGGSAQARFLGMETKNYFPCNCVFSAI